MSQNIRTLGVLALLTGALALTPGTSVGDVSVNVNIGPPPPIVVAAPPPLVIVPGVPVVRYAPSLQVDLFFFDHRWYYPHGGYWYVGPTYKGPWTFVPVGSLPRPIVAVPVQYYKVPPGHLKKYEDGGPPGHKGKGRGHS